MPKGCDYFASWGKIKYKVSHGRIRTGSDCWFSKILQIRTGSDSIFGDQDWTRAEKFHSLLISAICTHRTISHQFIWQQQQHRCDAVGGSPMECGVGEQPHKTPHFHPWHRHHPPEWPSQEEPGSGLTTSSDASVPACTNGVCPPLRPVSVAQKNKPSTMLFSNVQSIDLLMDCMAWRFWTMRQSNGWSTSVLRSTAAKQWFQQLAQEKKKKKKKKKA